MKVAAHSLRRAVDEFRTKGPSVFARAVWYLTASRLGRQTFQVNLPWGTLKVPANREKLGVGGYIFSRKERYEEGLRPCFDKCGGAFIDIGANVGYWACYMAGRAESVGRVTAIAAFEPQESIFRLMKRNVGNICEKHAFSVWTENMALGAHDGTVSAVSNNNDPGSAYVIPSENGAIKQMTLDHWIDSHRFENVALIKIDVEGYEYDVLAGALSTLKKFEPAIICELVETHQQRNHRSAREVFQLLRDLGYRGARIESDGSLRSSEQFDRDGDYFFVKTESSEP